ncbi:MAG: hypothetical protein ACLTYW_03015 [Collinsella sp.]
MSQWPSFNKIHQTNPAAENGAAEPRSGEQQQRLEQSDGREGLRGRLARVKFVASSARKGKHYVPVCVDLENNLTAPATEQQKIFSKELLRARQTCVY